MRWNVGSSVTMLRIPNWSRPDVPTQSLTARRSRSAKGLLPERGSKPRTIVRPTDDGRGAAQAAMVGSRRRSRLGPFNRLRASSRTAAVKDHEPTAIQPRRNDQRRPVRKMPQTSLLMLTPRSRDSKLSPPCLILSLNLPTQRLIETDYSIYVKWKEVTTDANSEIRDRSTTVARWLQNHQFIMIRRRVHVKVFPRGNTLREGVSGVGPTRFVRSKRSCGRSTSDAS
jgi:hypothetical protein